MKNSARCRQIAVHNFGSFHRKCSSSNEYQIWLLNFKDHSWIRYNRYVWRSSVSKTRYFTRNKWVIAFAYSFSMRKQLIFRDATTGYPAKWRLTSNCRNSILMTLTSQILAVLLIGLAVAIVVEKYLEFLQSLLRRHFEGKPALVSENVNCFLRLPQLQHLQYICPNPAMKSINTTQWVPDFRIKSEKKALTIKIVGTLSPKEPFWGFVDFNSTSRRKNEIFDSLFSQSILCHCLS